MILCSSAAVRKNDEAMKKKRLTRCSGGGKNRPPADGELREKRTVKKFRTLGVRQKWFAV